ncbi:MAG: AraC family transcriptional regulator [Aestuariibacter sp.]|nr:AraC family transcriptional regulator [Aestuariibacter sp.]
MISLSLLLIGFSIFSAMVIALTHFNADHYQGQRLSRTMGLLLLLALCALQVAHFQWLYLNHEWVVTTPYRMILFTVAPTFYLFCQPLICPQNSYNIGARFAGHALPIAISPLLPETLALPLAFIVGCAYLLWLARGLYALRLERANFRVEIFLLGGVFAIAVGVSVLGLAQAALADKMFFGLYAISIGLAFFLVQLALSLRPQLPIEVIETAQATYAVSTLTNIDCDTALSKLSTLIARDKIYTDSNLSLSKLSELLGLNPHQLSELMNNRLGKNFSRYLREHRIQAAKMMLCDEPAASVLSVGLSVGFSSQSSFYEAFREIEGTTPGLYRKVTLKN